MPHIFFTGILPFMSVLTGAFISGVTAFQAKSRADYKGERRQLAIKLYEEYHSKEMYVSRLGAARTLMDNPEGNLEYLYQKLPVESFMHISRVFHWIEKAGLYLKNNQIDASLTRSLLGRYFFDWYTLHHDRLAKDLPVESEFADMMSTLKYVASEMGRQSDARYYAQRIFRNLGT
jgi:Tfp pilus assembly protein PilO